MNEPKTQNRTLIDQFLSAASRAPYLPHWMYCGVCSKVTDHSLHIRGDYEYYTCPKCGNSVSYRTG